MGRTWLALVAVVVLAQTVAAVPFWGAKGALPPGTPPSAIEPGQFVWMADDVPHGPMTVIVSLDEQRAYVYRNGVEIGRARITVRDPGTPFGTHAFQVVEGGTAGKPSWVAIGVPKAQAKPFDPTATSRVTVPPAFLAQVRPLLTVGTRMVVTDEPIKPETTGVPLEVVNADRPPKKGMRKG